MDGEQGAERIGARDGAFSLVLTAGWERLGPDLGPAPGADIYLMFLGSQGRATIDATHRDVPPDATLRAPSDGGSPAHVLVDGHEAIAWCTTRRAGSDLIDTCTVRVLVGTRVYEFRLQSRGQDPRAARTDFEDMVRSVRF